MDKSWERRRFRQDFSFENFVSNVHHEDLENFEESILGTVIKRWVAHPDLTLNESVEFRVTASDQIRHMRCKGNIECDADGRPHIVLGYLEDITLIKEREMQDLMHLSKMAALGHTATAIVYEINNPLSVLVNYSSALMRYPSACENTETFHRFVEGIFRNSNRISEIVRAVKFFTGGGADQKLETTSLKSIFKETFNLCQENMKWSSGS